MVFKAARFGSLNFGM